MGLVSELAVQRRLREIGRQIAGTHPAAGRYLIQVAPKVADWLVMKERAKRALELLEDGMGPGSEGCDLEEAVHKAREVLATPPRAKCPHCLGSM
jgi:hypothetical protein